MKEHRTVTQRKNILIGYIYLAGGTALLAWDVGRLHGWMRLLFLVPGAILGSALFFLYDGYIGSPKRERRYRSYRPYAQFQQHALAARTRLANNTVTANSTTGTVVHVHRAGDGHEPLDPDRIPDSTTPIRGWRHWRLGGGELLDLRPEAFGMGRGRRLASVSHDYLWSPGENVAHCSFAPHGGEAAKACACGFYAFSQGTTPELQALVGLVTGAVEGWGRVQIHQFGWRAERAQITAIYDTEGLLMPRYGEDARNLPARIAEAYGVPLLPLPFEPVERYLERR